MSKKYPITLGLMAFLLILSGCASQPVSYSYELPSFFTGLWHGSIAWLALIGHLFSPDIRIYQFPNDGGLYDFGYMIGVGGGCSGVIQLIAMIIDAKLNA